MMTSSLHTEAIRWFEKGDMDNARSAVERFLQLEALDHVQFADGLLLLSCVLCGMREFEESERVAATCVGYLREHLGQRHFGIATALLNRGIILLERFAAASHVEELVRRQVNHSAALQHAGDVNRPSAAAEWPGPSAEADTTPASPSESVSWVTAAKGFLDEACDILHNSFGIERLLLADVHHALGCCGEILGTYTEAMEHYMRSLKIREKYKDSTGATDLKLALTLEHVAMVYRLTESKLPEACRLLAVVAQTRRRYLGPSNVLYARTLMEQGVCYYEQNHRRQARVLFERAHDVLARLVVASSRDAAVASSPHAMMRQCLLYLDDLRKRAAAADSSSAASQPQPSSRPRRPFSWELRGMDDADGSYGASPSSYYDTFSRDRGNHDSLRYGLEGDLSGAEGWRNGTSLSTPVSRFASYYSVPPASTSNDSVDLEVAHGQPELAPRERAWGAAVRQSASHVPPLHPNTAAR